jgi:hypothetical protein
MEKNSPQNKTLISMVNIKHIYGQGFTFGVSSMVDWCTCTIWGEETSKFKKHSLSLKT